MTLPPPDSDIFSTVLDLEGLNPKDYENSIALSAKVDFLVGFLTVCRSIGLSKKHDQVLFRAAKSVITNCCESTETVAELLLGELKTLMISKVLLPNDAVVLMQFVQKDLLQHCNLVSMAVDVGIPTTRLRADVVCIAPTSFPPLQAARSLQDLEEERARERAARQAELMEKRAIEKAMQEERNAELAAENERQEELRQLNAAAAEERSHITKQFVENAALESVKDDIDSLQQEIMDSIDANKNGLGEKLEAVLSNV